MFFSGLAVRGLAMGFAFLFPALWIKSGCDFRCQMLELTWTRMHVQSAFFWTTFPDLLAHLWHRFVLAASHEAAWFQRYLTMCEYEYIEQFNRWFLQQPFARWGCGNLRAGGFGFNKSQITGSSARYFCKPVLHSILVSYRKHLHLEWPGLQGTSGNKIETYTSSCNIQYLLKHDLR